MKRGDEVSFHIEVKCHRGSALYVSSSKFFLVEAGDTKHESEAGNSFSSLSLQPGQRLEGYVTLPNPGSMAGASIVFEDSLPDVERVLVVWRLPGRS